MTQKYLESKNCKKELNYTDSMDKDIVPCMAQNSFKATGWLGILTAGMLHNPSNFDNSITSLVKELTATCGDKLKQVTQKVTSNGVKALTTPQKGRAFIHILTNKYLAETGQVPSSER